MIVRQLRVLARLFGVALFVGLRRFAMRFGRFVVVFRCFVVVVFWHTENLMQFGGLLKEPPGEPPVPTAK